MEKLKLNKVMSNRKRVIVSPAGEDRLSYTCPHCNVIQIPHEVHVFEKEIDRINHEDNTKYISYNFNFGRCEGELQTGVLINKADQIIT